MTKNLLLRIAALVLTGCLILACSACGDDKSTGSKKNNNKKKPSSTSSDISDTDSSEPSSSDNGDDVTVIDLSKISSKTSSYDMGDDQSTVIEYKIADMFDNNDSTYWSPNSDKATTIEFSLKSNTSFNSIEFVENRSYINNLIIEAKQNGNWVQLTRLDEIGKRICILDNTFTAKDFRMTVSSTDVRGGIAEMKFSVKEAFKNGKSFRNVGYYTYSNIESMKKNNLDKLAGYTDIILFGYGLWDKEGNFLWNRTDNGMDEKLLQEMLAGIRSLNEAKNLKIWFCLQNYDTKTTTDTAELFATKESRDKLTAFAVDMCERYGFYGIDIDYEYPTNKTAWDNYNLFLNQCADALHAKGYKLSCAMSCYSIQLSPDTIKKIDYVNMMAYDIFDTSGRHSPYSLARQNVTYFTDLGFKPEQLVLGVPFYTRTMDSKHEFGKGYSGLAERWRSSLKPWVNIVDNKKWVYYYNGPNMLRDKVYYSMNQGLSGVFCWSMGSDLPNNNIYGLQSLGQSIIDAIARFSK